MKQKINQLLFVVVSILTVACVSDTYEAVSSHIPTLSVKFANPSSWNGENIPAGQQCRRYGGKGNTPSLIIENLPKGTNAIIVEYNDLSFAKLSSNGGHGKIGYWVKDNQKTITIPSIQGETAKLSGDAFVESNARAISKGYLPPCSGGRGNTYSATVKAVYKSNSQEKTNKLLGLGKIILGKY